MNKLNKRPKTRVEQIEEWMGIRQNVRSISLGMKLGILAAIVTAIYFLVFNHLLADNFLMANLGKFFVLGFVMFIGFALFKEYSKRPTFEQGLKLVTITTIITALTLLALELAFATMGSSFQLQPQMYAQAGISPITISFVTFIQVLVFDLIAGIGCMLYFVNRKREGYGHSIS